MYVDMRKYQIYIQDIAWVSKANEFDILINMRNKFHILKHPCIVLFIIQKITPIMTPQK